MSNETSNFGVLVIRPEVEVQAALGGLAVFEPDEVQPWQPTRLGPARISNSLADA
jgi:hypothetical protein